MKNLLLIGNVINLLEEGNSLVWGQLLEKVKKNCQIDTDLKNDSKPFL